MHSHQFKSTNRDFIKEKSSVLRLHKHVINSKSL